LSGLFVVPDCDGEREESLQHAGGDAGVGASAVGFEIELAFEGVVDGLDDLTERVQEMGAGAWRPVLVRGSQKGDVVVVEERFELSAGVALVGDEGLTSPTVEQPRFGLEEIAGDDAFVGLGKATRSPGRAAK
jgi:hypothetical protein